MQQVDAVDLVLVAGQSFVAQSLPVQFLRLLVDLRREGQVSLEELFGTRGPQFGSAVRQATRPVLQMNLLGTCTLTNTRRRQSVCVYQAHCRLRMLVARAARFLADLYRTLARDVTLRRLARRMTASRPSVGAFTVFGGAVRRLTA